MPTYFKRLRRKIGIVTLVMACVFAVGWVRSSFIFDGIEIVSTKSKYVLSSIRGQIRWFSAHSEQSRIEKREIRFPSFALKPAKTSESDIPKGFSGFAVGEFYLMSGMELWGHYSDLVQTAGPPVSVHQTIAQLPYWSIVIPLTLLSAWLLLSKPRSKPAPGTAPPRPDSLR